MIAGSTGTRSMPTRVKVSEAQATALLKKVRGDNSCAARKVKSPPPRGINAAGEPARKIGSRYAEPYGLDIPDWEGTKIVVKVIEAIRERPGLPRDAREWRWRLDQKWKFDLAFPCRKVAIEIEGGVFAGGEARKGHGGGAAYHANCDKYNQAQIDGWIVLRFTAKHIDRALDRLVDTIEDALKSRSTQECDCE